MIIVSVKAPPSPPPCTCNIIWDFKRIEAKTPEKQSVNDGFRIEMKTPEKQCVNDIKFVLEYTIS